MDVSSRYKSISYGQAACERYSIGRSVWAVFCHRGDGNFDVYCPSEIVVPPNVGDYSLDSKQFLRYFMVSYSCARSLYSRPNEKLQIRVMPCPQANSSTENAYLALGILTEFLNQKNPSAKSFKIDEFSKTLLEIFETNKICSFLGSFNRMHNALNVKSLTLNAFPCCRLPYVPNVKVVRCVHCKSKFHQRCLEIEDHECFQWTCRACEASQPAYNGIDLVPSTKLSWGGAFQNLVLSNICGLDCLLVLLHVVDHFTQYQLVHVLEQYTPVTHEFLIESPTMMDDMKELLKEETIHPVECTILCLKAMRRDDFARAKVLWATLVSKKNPVGRHIDFKDTFYEGCAQYFNSIIRIEDFSNCLEANCPHKLDVSFVEGLALFMCYVSKDVRCSQTTTLQDIFNAYQYPQERIPCSKCMFVDGVTRRLRASSCPGIRRYEERKIDGKVPPFLFFPVEHFNDDPDRFDNMLTFFGHQYRPFGHIVYEQRIEHFILLFSSEFFKKNDEIPLKYDGLAKPWFQQSDLFNEDAEIKYSFFVLDSLISL